MEGGTAATTIDEMDEHGTPLHFKLQEIVSTFKYMVIIIFNCLSNIGLMILF